MEAEVTKLRFYKSVLLSRMAMVSVFQILNLRRYCMISELSSIFSIEVVGGNLKKNENNSPSCVSFSLFKPLL